MGSSRGLGALLQWLERGDVLQCSAVRLGPTGRMDMPRSSDEGSLVSPTNPPQQPCRWTGRVRDQCEGKGTQSCDNLHTLPAPDPPVVDSTAQKDTCDPSACTVCDKRDPATLGLALEYLRERDWTPIGLSLSHDSVVAYRPLNTP